MWSSEDSVERAGRVRPDCSGNLLGSEDKFGTSGPMAWIFDGASSVSSGESVTSKDTDAIWMVEQLDNRLKALCYDPEPLKVLVARVLHEVAVAAADEWTGQPEVPPSAALGVVRRTDAGSVEFLVLADVSVILRAEAGPQWFVDHRVDVHNQRAEDVMVEALRDPTVSFDEARARARPYLAEPRLSAMNKPDGYWVASTDPTAADHALTGVIDGVDEVILATDGFMRAVDLFGLVPDAAALFERDFEKLADEIRKIETGPDSRDYPRWSVSDDICAHRLRWID